jgi:hypothetical protein
VQSSDEQLIGGIWPLGSTDENPEVVVESWAVHEVQLPNRPERTRHIVGLTGRHRDGVVSSSIVEVDATANRITTESGRTYRVIGGTGGNLDSIYVWNRWRTENDATIPIDVTSQIKQILTITVVDWELTEYPHPQDPRRKRMQVSGSVQGTGAAYVCGIKRFNRLAMEGIDANGRFFRLTIPANSD